MAANLDDPEFPALIRAGAPDAIQTVVQTYLGPDSSGC